MRIDGSHAWKLLAARPRFVEGIDTTLIDELMIHLEMSSCYSNNWSELLISRLAQAWWSNKTNSQWNLCSHSSKTISLKTTRGGSFPALYSCPCQNIAIQSCFKFECQQKKHCPYVEVQEGHSDVQINEIFYDYLSSTDNQQQTTIMIFLQGRVSLKV